MYRCKRCEGESLEVFGTYVVCHDCNLNSPEGYSWRMREDRFGFGSQKPEPTPDEDDSDKFQE